MRFKSQLKTLFRCAFRNDCLLCARDIKHLNDKTDFCAQCLSQFEKNLVSCETCAIPLSENELDLMTCGGCQIKPPPWQRAISTYRYEYPLSKILIALKYQRRLEYIASLASLMSKDLRICYDFDSSNVPDYIVPVPQHFLRKFMRGYNQAELLAVDLSNDLNIPILTDLVQRVRHTPKQSSLTKKQRQKNLKGAFKCKTLNIPRYVALVDDVMTTGSTAEAITKALLAAGVERVDIWCCARAEL